MTAKGYLPALAGVFTASALYLCAQYLSLLFAPLTLPSWLWLFVLASALESAYYAAYFLGPRTPFTVRLLELALWLVPIFLLAGRELSVFLWPALLTLVSWLVARGWGMQLVRMEKVADVLGDQAASTVSWEYESLTSRGQDDLALGFFWRRLLGFGAVVVTLATLVYRSGLVEGSLSVLLKLQATVAGASGLALLGGAYLFRLQILWSYAKAVVDPGLTRAWFRNLALILLFVVALVHLAPVNYSPITAETVAGLAARLFQPKIELPQLEEPVPGEGPSLSWAEQAVPQPEDLGIMGLALAIAAFLLLVLFVTVLLAAFGFIVIQLTKGELERLRGLPKLAVEIYAALRRAAAKVLAALRGLRISLPLGRRVKLPGMRPPGGGEQPSRRRFLSLDKGVRALLRRIARQAGKKGLRFRASQTPREFGQLLQGKLEHSEELVEQFFQGYHLARYSGRQLSGAQEEEVVAAGTELLQRIQTWEGDSKS